MTTRVLIVDDEAAARRVLRRFMQGAGRTIEDASSAEEALALIDRTGPPAVAVCDVRMPGRDGVWLAQHIRAYYSSTAVVMGTAVENFHQAVSCVRIGVTDWIAKPFSKDAVRHAIDRALAVHAAAARAEAMMASSSSDSELNVNLWNGVDAVISLLEWQEPVRARRARRRAKLAVNIALALGLPGPAVAEIELASLLYETALGMDPTQPGGSSLFVRTVADHVAHVPVLSRAAVVLAAASEDAPDAADGRVAVGARIVQVARDHDERTDGDMRPPALRKTARALAGSADEVDRLMMEGLRVLVLVGGPSSPDATFMRWLNESWQRVSEARRSGHRSSIHAAYAAHEELRLSVDLVNGNRKE